ncbi:hypothetical protein DXG03_007973 [Asterophora parasitica]|uniref:non-specific serine/threonine protein kinase n=1 Tax=Asterophora parasitica TaxID=117018 RepID=A0A9P7G858_9AGAR|nr:hypothetical protein DXG03_007973 [Asterophora parasitica]
MAPLLYLTAFLFAFISACIAEVISLRSTPGKSQALIERGHTEYSFISPPALDVESTVNELDLLDTVLVASVDGKFHALNRTSGKTLWSMPSFTASTSISAPSTLAPLVRTTHVDHDPEMTDETTSQELYVIEPQSGDIYVMATPTSPLQRFPFSMSELVDMSPFTFTGDEDRRVFVGRKETSLLLLELETGRVKATLNSECAWDQDDEDDGELDLDELEDNKTPISIPTEVYIGRTDYHISIQTRPLKGNSAIKAPIQNLSFSVYGPNNKDNNLQATYRRTKDDAYIQSLPSGEIISFKARQRGEPFANADAQVLWAVDFNNPIVAVFDVLQKPFSHAHARNNTLVLLQPRPHLQDVLPNLTPETVTRLPNRESAYVGMVQETGSLFAMSPARFPLVAFGGAERYPRRYLIDASKPEDDDDGKDDLPLSVDAITKARQWGRERNQDECRGHALYTNRRCLVGVRPLEEGDGHEGRLKRLLDGPTGVPWAGKGGMGGAQQVRHDALTGVNVTLGVGAALPLTVIEATANAEGGWAKATHRNVLEAIAITAVLGAASLWFWLKRSRQARSGGGRAKGSVTSENATPTLVVVPITPAYAESPPPTSILSDTTEKAIPIISVPPTVPVESSVASDPALPSSPPPASEKPKPINQVNGNAIPTTKAADDSDREGEANDDVLATPGKRKNRRGKRGKKKKAGVILPEEDEREEEDEKEKPSTNGNIGKSESPRMSSLVVNSPKPPPAAASLVVSDQILGIYPVNSWSFIDGAYRLGFGSHGTVVFQGSLQGRAVAVKRLLQDFVTLASREVSILQESDDHPNVIRYYYQEAHANFLYIALELCPASLADIVECPDRDQWRDIAIAFDPKRALKQITSGLKHLHALKLVHRDIKPQNILVSGAKPGPGGKSSYRMLISDFGLCKKLDVDQTSFLPTAHGAMAAGTVGWRAPEILRGEVKLDDLSDDHSMSSRGSTSTATGTPSNSRLTRLTKSVDIFALGCLFYYTLTNGGHPFGDRFEREVNIMKNEKNLEALERFGEEGSEAVDLITTMLDPEAYERPDTITCLLHPFFWNPARRLNFLQDASDRFEIMCRDPRDPYLLVLEKEASGIVGNDWHSRLDKIFIENLGKFRKYDGRSVQDLLRALRNKKHHYQDLPDNVKRHLGPMPEGFLTYFTRRFPRLFLHVHGVVGSTGLHSESMFRGYFELAE